MLERLKTLLRQQYIGAIVTALIIVDALRFSLSLFLRPLFFWFSTMVSRRESILGLPEKPAFDWKLLLSPLAETMVYAGVACLLVRWLFWNEAEPTGSGSAGEQSDAVNSDAVN